MILVEMNASRDALAEKKSISSLFEYYWVAFSSFKTPSVTESSRTYAWTYVLVYKPPLSLFCFLLPSSTKSTNQSLKYRRHRRSPIWFFYYYYSRNKLFFLCHSSISSSGYPSNALSSFSIWNEKSRNKAVLVRDGKNGEKLEMMYWKAFYSPAA